MTPPVSTRGLSLRRRLGLIAALAVLLFVGATTAFVGMRREFHDRLVERAQFEVERAVERVDSVAVDAPSVVEACSVGQLRAGVSEAAGPSGSALGVDADDAAAIRRRVHGIGQMRCEVVLVRGAPVVVAMRARPDANVAWAAVVVEEPPVVRFWKLVAAALVLVCLALLAAAVDAVRRVRRASEALTSSARALASDLRAAVAEPGVNELAGVASALRVLAHDLDDAQRARETLVTALAHERQLSALGRMAAGIAHEVRNPLAAIKLRADLAREGTGTEAERRHDLEVLGREVDRLGRLVTDLLAHARVADVSPTACDLAALVTERVALLDPCARERGIALRVSGGGSARVDADAATRALDNLLRNAIDASPEGAAVDVEVRRCEAATEVMVSDEGPGVLPARAAELFEPFFTTKPRGTGLGLSLARAVVRAHAGDITYRRAEGRTTFTMRFPS